MKNAILMVAAMGMFGGAFADQSTKVDQIVTAHVDNVCTYAVDSQTDVNGLQYMDHAAKDLGSGNALKQTDGSINLGDFYIFRCTSGTNWDTTPFAKKGTLPLSLVGGGAGDKKLSVEYTVTTGEDLNTVNGDIHTAGLNLTVPKGQWQAKSGDYKGTLTVTINYN
jgi:hypothetical protein